MGGEKACKLASILDGSWVCKRGKSRFINTLCVCESAAFPKSSCRVYSLQYGALRLRVSLSPVVTSIYQSIPDNKLSRA